MKIVHYTNSIPVGDNSLEIYKLYYEEKEERDRVGEEEDSGIAGEIFGFIDSNELETI